MVDTRAVNMFSTYKCIVNGSRSLKLTCNNHDSACSLVGDATCMSHIYASNSCSSVLTAIPRPDSRFRVSRIEIWIVDFNATNMN